MADGSKKNIEDVLIGEKLMGQNGVINTVLEYDHPMLNGRDLIALNGGKPFMTPEHPLMTKEGWKSWSAEMTQWQKPDIAHLMVNGDLEVGDEILMDNGHWMMIESIEVHSGEPEQQVYNFYLDGNNTYFADGLLAHNRGGQDPSCFVAGTQVIMADGSRKNIEDVQIGEQVQGINGINNVIAHDHWPLAGRKLIGINGSGPFKTPEHPLMTQDGWKAFDSEVTKVEKPQIAHLMVNGSLQIGDKILMADGSWKEIESLEVFENEPEQTVYNFVLDGDHTYYADDHAAHNRDPLAQSFFPPLNQGQDGMFATKVDIYFSSKDSTLPVWIELRPVENGSPINRIVPSSQVYKYPNEITTSTDASVATTFEFDEPIYLMPDTEYAVCIQSNSEDYNVFIARVGDFILGTTERKITKRPFFGSLFKSQNARTWTPYQWEDLKMTVHVASFKSDRGYANLKNLAIPERLLNPNPITTTSGDATVRVNHPSHGFTVGDTVTLTGTESVGGISDSDLYGERVITAIDANGYTYEADSAANVTITAGGSGITANENYLMDVGFISLSTLQPGTTTITADGAFTTGQSLAGTETAYQKDASTSRIDLNRNIAFPNPKLIANSENEATYLSGAKSVDLFINLNSSNKYVSPVIDMQRASIVAISNIIDKQNNTPAAGYNVPLTYVEETSSVGGTHAAKHITRPITLASEAVGLKILLTANRPSAANFDMYYRTTTDGDLATVGWTLVNKENEIPSDEDPTVFRQYQYLIGGRTGTLDGFTQFQLKIVMTSTNSAKVPVFRDIRAIALGV